MNIIADEEIPFVAHYFSHVGDIIFKNGRALVHDDLLIADILLARSVTPINQFLLAGTPVKFVGSTVAGVDHMDIHWLEQQGIRWANAPGCNADAVADYVVSVVAALQNARLLPQHSFRAGVIGVGKIGSRVVEKLKLIGADVIQYDPLRADNEPEYLSTPLSAFTDLDFVTLHTPLTNQGRYSTFHMIGKAFLQQQKKDCVLLNTSRGAVIDSKDLTRYGRHLHWCFDVWEHEPTIDKDVLANTLIATQHIAGHSIQAKYRGIEMVYQKACQLGVIAAGGVLPVAYPTKTISFAGRPASWRNVILAVFDPLEYTKYIKHELLNTSKSFDQLRKEFVQQYEFKFVRLEDVLMNAEDKALVKRLGINI